MLLCVLLWRFVLFCAKFVVFLWHTGKYQVTQSEYEIIMGKNPSNFQTGKGFLGFGRKENANKNFPVEQISWFDAVEFCNKKREKEGLEKCYSGSGDQTKCDFSKNGYRLSTEAEWEYAARGGSMSLS